MTTVQPTIIPIMKITLIITLQIIAYLERKYFDN